MAAAAAMIDADMGKALWDAAGAGNTGEVARLLEAGAPVNWDVLVSTGFCGAGGGVVGSRGGPGEELAMGWFQHLSAAAWYGRAVWGNAAHEGSTTRAH